VDSKARIQVPVSFRRHMGVEGGELFVITRSKKPYLILFGPDGWKDFQGKLNEQAPGADKRQRIRFFSHNSATLQLDKQGRLSIPKEFLADLGDEQEVLLVGAFDYIEIWRAKDFDKHLDEADDAIGEIEDLL
jgi:MraZ protein